MLHRLLMLALLSFCLITISLGAADPEHKEPEKAASGDSSAHLKKLMDGNARFLAGKATHPDQDPARRKELASGQSPFAVILACADSRVSPEIVFDQGLGDLFVVRVAGNVVDESGLASIEYAVAHLGARLVVVLGHSSCGAVDATVKEVKEESHLKKLTTAIEPAVATAKKQGSSGILDAAIRANALMMAAKLADSKPVLHDRVKAGQVQVLAARYDLSTGAVEWLESNSEKKANEKQER